MKKHTVFLASWLTLAGTLFNIACNDKEKPKRVKIW
jgi:hypothetical protein